MSGSGSKVELVHRFFSGTGSTYDRVVDLATFGIDRRWKRRIVARIPTDARRVLDLACGTGILTLRIARRLPAARVIGVELRDEYLELARRKLAASGLDNVELVLERAEEYRASRPFDCVVSSYLAKYADIEALAGAAHGWLRPGGLFLAHDFTFPPNRALVLLWRAYFRVLQAVGTPLLPAWRTIFHGLPELIEATRWCEALEHALARHGFTDIERRYLTACGSAIVAARRSPSASDPGPLSRARARARARPRAARRPRSGA